MAYASELEPASAPANPPPASATASHGHGPADASERTLAIIAGATLLLGWVCQLVGYAAAGYVLLGLSYLSGGWIALQAAIARLKEFELDVDVLMLLAAIVAAILGQVTEGALLLVLFAASRAMEGYTQHRAEAALHGLQKMLPETALKLTSDGPVATPIAQIAIGDRVLVRAGDRVPVDGVIREGASSVDTSALTGESVPRELTSGDVARAGSLNLTGRLTLSCTARAEESTLARVIALVASASADRPRAQRLLDRIGPYIAWSVLGASALVTVLGGLIFYATWGEAVLRGLTLMIVGSPCALIVATPAAYLAALSAAARMGVLVKGGRHFEALASAKVIVFDKTGTLTTGDLRLTGIQRLDPGKGLAQACGPCGKRALSLAAGLEQGSSHPLARAILNAAQEQQVPVTRFASVETVAGLGLEGKLACIEPVRIGRRSFVEHVLRDLLAHQPGDHGQVHAHKFAKDAVAELDKLNASESGGVWLLAGGELFKFAFADTVRPEAADVIRQLQTSGLTHAEMLTGDHAEAAADVARQVGLGHLRAGLLPEEKLARARQLAAEVGPVAMVGDGANDAATLASVACGIAIGQVMNARVSDAESTAQIEHASLADREPRTAATGGTDVAIDAAPIVLLNGTLSALPRLFAHAQRTRSIVTQNLAFAILVIVVMSVLSVAYPYPLPLPLAVLSHEGSTVLVALNALRLLRG